MKKMYGLARQKPVSNLSNKPLKPEISLFSGVQTSIHEDEIPVYPRLFDIR